MIVKKIQGLAVLLWEESHSGFTRNKPIEYIGFDPRKAIEIGEKLQRAGREILNEENR